MRVTRSFKTVSGDSSSASATNQKGNDARDGSTQKDGGGCEEEDSKLSPMTGSASRANQRGTPNARGGYVKTHGGGPKEEDSKPSPVTGSCAAQISSDIALEEVLQDAATHRLSKSLISSCWPCSSSSKVSSPCLFGRSIGAL